MSTTNILDLNNRIDALEKNSGGGGSSDSAKRSDIATEFNTTTAYTAGCYVYHEGKLYQFNTDHAAGAWDPTDVVAANVTDQIVSNALAIAGLTASDVAYNNTDSGITATDVQGAVDEIIEKQIQYIVHDITDLNINTAWGELFAGGEIVGISSLGLQNAPTIVSAVFVPSSGGTAWVVVNSVSVTAIDCSLVRASSATVNGKMIIGYRL